jgi:hypothetical protein
LLRIHAAFSAITATLRQAASHSCDTAAPPPVARMPTKRILADSAD